MMVKTSRTTFRVTTTDEGFADLLADEADIVMALREIRPEERARAEEAGMGDMTGAATVRDVDGNLLHEFASDKGGFIAGIERVIERAGLDAHNTLGGPGEQGLEWWRSGCSKRRKKRELEPTTLLVRALYVDFSWVAEVTFSHHCVPG